MDPVRGFGAIPSASPVNESLFFEISTPVAGLKMSIRALAGDVVARSLTYNHIAPLTTPSPCKRTFGSVIVTGELLTPVLNGRVTSFHGPTSGPPMTRS